MTSSESTQKLSHLLQMLSAHWDEAVIFLSYLEGGLMTEGEINELIGYIESIDLEIAQGKTDDARKKTQLLLVSLRTKEAIERSCEQSHLQISL